MSAPLRIKAVDASDLAVVSSFLQDAVVQMGDMIYQRGERRFVLAAYRFRWEDAGETQIVGRIYERQRCGIRFDRVRSVRSRDLDRRRRSEILSLLAIDAGDDGFVDLIFAGGGVIRLEVEAVLCHLDDFDEPRPTMWRPTHPETAAEDRN